MSHNWKTGIAVQLVYIQTRRVICRVNIVSSSFFFPEEIPFVFVVRLKCWWFHQGIRIPNQNKTCKILYNNKKIWYWKLHTKAVETRESVSTYIRLAEERRHIVGNKLNVRCDASYLFPFLSNLFFSFWGRRCILRVIAPTHQPFWATSFESRNMKHSFQKETKETEKFRRAWNKWKTNKFPDRKKQKKNKRGSKCNKKQLWMLYILWSDVYYKTNLDNTRQPSDIYQ